MRQVLRMLSVALLAFAVANPLAAVCLCHQAQNPVAHEHSCCRQSAPAGPVLSDVLACCHTEQADHGVAQVDQPQVLSAPSLSSPMLLATDLHIGAALRARTPVPPFRVTVLRA
jgi:hypothetical protein